METKITTNLTNLHLIMLVFVISLIKPNILTKFQFIKNNKIKKIKKNLYKKLKILKNPTKKL